MKEKGRQMVGFKRKKEVMEWYQHSSWEIFLQVINLIFEGPALIPIVGKNTWGEVNQYSKNSIIILFSETCTRLY